MSARLKPYPSYKDSGVEWLGRIPAHWESYPLKHVTQFVNGAPFKPTDWCSEGVPIIRIENLNGGEEFNRTTLTVNRRYEVQKGDILFGWSGNRGTSFGPFIWQKDGLFYLNQHIFRIEGFQAHRSWFYWMLKAVTLFVEQQAHGIIGLVHVTKGDLGVIKIPFPSHEEQQAIATFLDRETGKMDALVGKMERLIELLQEKRTALISHAVTQGLNPNAPKKDSGIPWLGHIPKHWDVKKVKHVAEILRGMFTHRPRNDPRMYDGHYPFIQTGDVAGAQKFVREYHQTLSEEGFKVSKMFPRGTLVMTIAANVGDMAILDFEACFPDSIVGFVPHQDADLTFLYYLFAAMKPEFMATATINTQLNLNIERIGSLWAGIPPRAEQEAIATFLDRETAKMDALMAKVRTAIDRLQEYRMALISAAVTGQIDVRLCR